MEIKIKDNSDRYKLARAYYGANKEIWEIDEEGNDTDQILHYDMEPDESSYIVIMEDEGDEHWVEYMQFEEDDLEEAKEEYKRLISGVTEVKIKFK